MTNPNNDAVECLSFADLYALIGPESEGFNNWSDAQDLATQLGSQTELPDEELTLVGPGPESGTYDSFIEIALSDIAEAQGLPEADWESLRNDYQASPNDNVIITAMEGSSSALGFVGFAFAEEAGDAVKELEIDGGDGCVAPSAATVSDGSYPLSRSLYIYVSADAAARPEVAAYVDYYVSDEAMTSLVEEVGYIPLPADRIEATRTTWESAAA
jgi:phosphate transport system substrate-binding protein